MTAPVLAAAIFCCCNHNNNIQMQNCKVPTRKKKQKRKPLQTEFFADSKILGFISLSKLYRNTNKNQAFLIPKAKKPRPRKASSHLMVETPPQPRARPPLLWKNTLLIKSVTAAEADRALHPRKPPRPSKYRESARRRDREKNFGWESNQGWGSNSHISSDSNNDSTSTSGSNILLL